jgi:hypothetical protein
VVTRLPAVVFLRLLRNATCCALGTPKSSAVAPTGSTFTTTPELTFPRSKAEAVVAEAEVASLSRLVSLETLPTAAAGCTFAFFFFAMQDSERTCSDNAFGRIFPFQQPGNPTLTIQSCVTTCASQNFTLAGTEFGSTYPFRLSHCITSSLSSYHS